MAAVVIARTTKALIIRLLSTLNQQIENCCRYRHQHNEVEGISPMVLQVSPQRWAPLKFRQYLEVSSMKAQSKPKSMLASIGKR